MVLSSSIENMKDSEDQVIEYHSPSDLSKLAQELNVILVNIDHDCTKLAEDSQVEDIRLQLENHTKDVEDLTKRVLS